MSQPTQDHAAQLPNGATLRHSFIPVPESLIAWCQLSSHLARFDAQAWAFVYIDSATNQPIGLQAVQIEDLDKLLTAARDESMEHGWRALEWVDLMPDAVPPAQYPQALLAALQRRRQYLYQQLSLLTQHIEAQQLAVAGLPPMALPLT